MSPWSGSFGNNLLAPFASDPLLASTMNELQRVQHRALQVLPPQLRLDVFETEKEFKVRADLPGFSDKDVLTIPVPKVERVAEGRRCIAIR